MAKFPKFCLKSFFNKNHNLRNISEFSPKKYPLVLPLKFSLKFLKKSRGKGVNFTLVPLWDFFPKKNFPGGLHPTYTPLVNPGYIPLVTSQQSLNLMKKFNLWLVEVLNIWFFRTKTFSVGTKECFYNVIQQI